MHGASRPPLLTRQDEATVAHARALRWLPIKVSEDMVGAASVSGSPSKDDDCSQTAIAHLSFGAAWARQFPLTAVQASRSLHPIFQLPLGASARSHRRECLVVSRRRLIDTSGKIKLPPRS